MRRTPCTGHTRRGRMAKAEEFLDNAELLADDPDCRNAAASLFVDAGIAASDVLCCAALGEHASGQDHNEAVGLLAQVDKEASKRLRTLLISKTKISYSANPLPGAEFRRVARAAAHLLELARTVRR